MIIRNRILIPAGTIVPGVTSHAVEVVLIQAIKVVANRSLILFYSDSDSILFYSVLFYSILFCSILLYSILFCSIILSVLVDGD